MLMMMSQILKFVDFTTTPKFRYCENESWKIMRSNKNQEQLFCKKLVLQQRLPLKIGPKSKKKNCQQKAKSDTKGEITQVWNELLPKLFH